MPEVALARFLSARAESSKRVRANVGPSSERTLPQLIKITSRASADRREPETGFQIEISLPASDCF